MNRVPFTATTRNSVNLTGNCFQPAQQDTTVKGSMHKRFSYQDGRQHHMGIQKQNKRGNSVERGESYCLNHPQQAATYSALQNTSDPMHLCERCAIMVASKGFQIAKKIQKRQQKQEQPPSDYKTLINSTFNSIKATKNQTLERLASFQMKMKSREQEVEEFFMTLQQFLEEKKENCLQGIGKCRRELETVRHEANRYYMTMLEKVRQISKESTNVSADISSQFSYYLQELSKGIYKIPAQKITIEVTLKPVLEVMQQIESLLTSRDGKHVRSKNDLRAKCEKDNSSIRSLQLSFEQENDQTLRLEGEGGKGGVESGLSSNLLNSMGIF